MGQGDDPVAELLIGGIRAVWSLGRFFVRRPGLTLAVVVAPATLDALGPIGTGAGIGGGVVALIAWRLASPSSFGRMVRDPIHRRPRLHRYRRRWRRWVLGHGLVVRYPDRVALPKLRRVRCARYVDRLTVQLAAGQTPEDFENQADGLAHAAASRSCRVVVDRPGRIVLEMARLDPLATVVAALPIREGCDLWSVPVGVREDGSAWLIRLAGSHVLVVGVTGAGKGSVMWSLLRGIAPAVRGGVAQVWAVDPKGGMELSSGQAMFARFAADEFETMADLLDDAVALMRERAARLAGHTRRHEPSSADPLVVLLIDELANLTAYLQDRKLRDRIAQSVAVLLTQGRAVGVTVVAALQDPRKEVIAFRNLFPTKVALRLDEPSQVDMVLGDGARRRGARCDQIPESLPGVGYVRVDGVREPVRVRAAFVSDADIAEVVTVASTGVAPTPPGGGMDATDCQGTAA